MISKIRLDRVVRFCAAHFLPKHDKCSRLHGHNYCVSVEVKGELDKNGFLVDFAVVKSHLECIVSCMDHKTLIPQYSHEIVYSIKGEQVFFSFDKKDYMLPIEDVCLLPIVSSTAECIAQYIAKQALVLFPSFRVQVQLFETEGASAIFPSEVDTSGTPHLQLQKIPV